MNIADTRIDNNFTKILRTALETRGKVTAPVITIGEARALTRGDFLTTADLPLHLTRAALFRSTGLDVDLATQGPASSNIVKKGASVNQQHNTFSVSLDESRDRRFRSTTTDHENVPKLTPQDANRAVGSLDFPSTRPRGTPIQGLKLDDKENPYEKVFVDQLTVGQIMHHWGADYMPIVKYIDRAWQITYAKELIENVSLCRASDLTAYLANGGRPAPSVYISPNIMSRYTVDESPRVSFEKLGYSGAFVGRSRKMAQFIMATLGIVYGEGCTFVEDFHMNPAHLSKFSTDDLVEWVIELPSQVPRALGRETIAAIDTYDEYVRARLTVRSAETATREHAKDVLNALAATRSKALDSYKNRVFMKGDTAIMATINTASVNKDVATENAAPSRLTALLLAIFHGPPDPAKYLTLVSTCHALLVLAFMDYESDAYVLIWKHLMQGPGLHDLVEVLNLSRIKEIEEVNAMLRVYPRIRNRELIAHYVIGRQIAFMKTTINSAVYETNTLIFRDTKDPLFGSKEIVVQKVGKLVRPIRLVEDMLNYTYGTRPYSYLTRFKQVAVTESAKCSLLIHRNDAVYAYLIMADNHNMHRMRPLVSSLRHTWCGYYLNEALMIKRLVRSICAVEPKATCRLDSKVFDDTTRVGKSEWLIRGFALEYAAAMSKYFMYKWYHISPGTLAADLVVDDKMVASEFWTSTVNAYINALKAGKDIKFKVDPKAHQLAINSGIRADVAKRLEEFAAICNETGGEQVRLVKAMTNVVRDHYANNSWVFEATLKDAINNDRASVAPTVAAKPAAAVVGEPADLSNFDEMFGGLVSHIHPDSDKAYYHVKGNILAGAADLDEYDMASARMYEDFADTITEEMYESMGHKIDKISNWLSLVKDGEDMVSTVVEEVDKILSEITGKSYTEDKPIYT